jgi:hypothetical protein
MARKRNDRSNRSEQTDSQMERNGQSEPLDDSAMSRTHRDDMSTTPAQGDDLSERESSSQREESQRGRRTQQRANDERFDDASEFSGQGGQKEGESEDAEGTGYTEDSNR